MSGSIVIFSIDRSGVRVRGQEPLGPLVRTRPSASGRTGRWQATDQLTAERRPSALQAGVFAFATFGFAYERTAGRRRRVALATADRRPRAPGRGDPGARAAVTSSRSTS
ncbi:hypothetical protein ACLFMI_07125 [Pseudonocardia nantongensis]|uniref:hypothetical protein n=1 Tax=Pseudonocardia nantongensis TaxID=1181885 RepID=UPI003977FE11